MAAKAASGTLTANTVASVSITDVGYQGVNVINRSAMAGTSTTPIWVRLDGTDPVVGANECFPVYGVRRFATDTSITVKLISSAALDYTVERVA